jgi:hypothetical protein
MPPPYVGPVPGRDHPDMQGPDPVGTRKVALGLLVAAGVIVPVNTLLYFVWLSSPGGSGDLFMLWLGLAALQTVAGLAAMIAGIVYTVRRSRAKLTSGGGILMSVLGFLVSAGGVVGGLLGVVGAALASGGGAWGRPLRIRGRVMHPELRAGEDWTRGERPDARDLDEPTRRALEALWLHDAQKEHASVPAFARVAWMLAAVGAPAELAERTFTAAQEEIAHTRLCFALAAGYGGRSHSVEPMPELLVSGLDVRGNALVHLSLESLKDGCLLEDYNADVAGACAQACREPVTRRVLEQIAVEERSHAELSWSILEFCLRRGGAPVRSALARARAELADCPRPTAVSGEKAALVAKADPAALRAHGRLPDAEWAAIYDERFAATLACLDGMLAEHAAELRPAA